MHHAQQAPGALLALLALALLATAAAQPFGKDQGELYFASAKPTSVYDISSA